MLLCDMMCQVISKGGITYKNTSWHRDCFTCTNCSKILAGEKFTSQEDRPYCAECYGLLFAKKCDLCTKPITGINFYSSCNQLFFCTQTMNPCLVLVIFFGLVYLDLNLLF